MSAVKKVGTPKPLPTTVAKPAVKEVKKENSKRVPKETSMDISKVISNGDKEEKKSTVKTVKPAIYIQYADKQLGYDEIVKQVKDAWVFEGNKINQIKSLDIYVKPEDNAVYYVINGDVNGSILM